MTSDDAIPDRDELQHAADRRTRRFRLVGIVAMTVALLLVPVVYLLVDHGADPGRVTLIGLIPVGVFVAVAVPILVWQRGPGGWSTTPLSAGTPRGTRQAVRRAIRTGHAPDARIGALAYEQAEQTAGNKTIINIWITLTAVQLVLYGVRLSMGGDPFSMLLWGAGVLFMGTALILLVLDRRRSRRYLRAHQS